MTVPNTLQLYQPIFLNQNGDKIIIATNYLAGEKVRISDLRNNGGFELQVSSSPLLLGNSIALPYDQNIGILTFNSNPTTAVDGTRTDTSITALNDKNYTYNSLTSTTANENDFVYFSGTNPSESDALANFIYAPDTGTRYGEYSFGFGVIIKIPSHPETIPSLFAGVSENNYNLNLNFTLIPN